MESSNPRLNTKTCKVEFQDEYIHENLANTIVEHMNAQVDTEGNESILL